MITLKRKAPLLLAISSMILSAIFYPDWIIISDVIKGFPDIGTFTFGFLLTLFGLIHQGSSTVITNFKAQKSLYRRFVCLNRNAVFISLFLTLFSFLITNILDFNKGAIICNRLCVAIFIGGFVYFAITSIYFLMVFYKLAEIDA